MSSSPKSPPPDFAGKLFINNMSLKQSNLFTGSVLLLLGLIFLLASMTPTAHITRIRPASDCNQWIFNNLGLTCDSFTLDSNPVALIDVVDLTPKNKFVTLELLPFKKSNNTEAKTTVKIEVSAYTIEENDPSVKVYSPDTQELTFDCSDATSSDCGTQTVVTLTNLKYKSYYFVVKFANGQDLSTLFKDFAFSTTTLSTSYKNYVFFVKLIFMLASFGGYVYYIIKTFSMKKELYCDELKSLELLFPFLLLINEPFTSQVFGGFIYSWVIIAAFIAFSAFQIKLWISSAQKIVGPDPSIYYINEKLLKAALLAYAGVTWMTYVIYQSFVPEEQPGSGFLLETNIFFNLFRLPFLVILGLLVFYMVQSTKVLRKKADESNEREHYFFWYSAFFFVVHVLLVALGGLSPVSHDGTKQLLFSGISTVYILTASYLYLPNKEGAAEGFSAGDVANPRSKGTYLHLDDSHAFAPQAAANQGQGTVPGKATLKSPAAFGQENYPPEIRADEDL